MYAYAYYNFYAIIINSSMYDVTIYYVLVYEYVLLYFAECLSSVQFQYLT